jgi:hypothetical protein
MNRGTFVRASVGAVAMSDLGADRSGSRSLKND